MKLTILFTRFRDASDIDPKILAAYDVWTSSKDAK